MSKGILTALSLDKLLMVCGERFPDLLILITCERDQPQPVLNPVERSLYQNGSFLGLSLTGL